MKDKTTRFLSVSAVAISIICAVVFSFLAFYMNKQSRATITDVGTIYMTGMNDSISIHFRTTIEQSLSQL